MNLFISTKEKRVFEYIYFFKSGYCREISHKLALPAITVSRILKRLYSKKILKLSKSGNIKHYTLNLSNFMTIGLIDLIENERIENSKLKGVSKMLLERLNSDALFLCFFGSYVRGGETKTSDLDILFVSSDRFSVNKICRDISTITGINISPHTLSPDEIRKLLEKKEAFVVNNILIPKNRIFLLGADNFFKIFRDFI